MAARPSGGGVSFYSIKRSNDRVIVKFLHVPSENAAKHFTDFVKDLDRIFERRNKGERFGVLFDARAISGSLADQLTFKDIMVGWMERNKERIREHFTKSCLLTTNFFVQALYKAVLTVKPPERPSTSATSLSDALRFLEWNVKR